MCNPVRGVAISFCATPTLDTYVIFLRHNNQCFYKERYRHLQSKMSQLKVKYMLHLYTTYAQIY